MILNAIKVDKLVSIYIFLVLFGYQTFASIFSVFQNETIISLGTYFYRAIVLLIGFIIFIYSFKLKIKKNSFENIFLYLFFLFWSLFFIRFIFDALMGKLSDYIIYFYSLSSIFFTFIPIVFLIRNISKKVVIDFAYISYFALIIVLLITPFSFYAALEDQLISGGRVSSERLNPITFGRSAVFLFFISIYLFSIKKINGLSLFIVGFFSILGVIISGSRGSLVGFITLLLILSSANLFKRIDLKQFFITIFITLFAVSSSLIITSYFLPDFDLVNNLLNAGTIQDRSSQIRFQLYEGALSQFLQNPLLGNSIIEEKYSFYPHNIFLETLMALGIVGALILLVILVIILKKGFANLLLFKVDNHYSFLFNLFLVSLIAHQFSGSIFYTQELWGLIILCIFYKHSLKSI